MTSRLFSTCLPSSRRKKRSESSSPQQQTRSSSTLASSIKSPKRGKIPRWRNLRNPKYSVTLSRGLSRTTISWCWPSFISARKTRCYSTCTTRFVKRQRVSRPSNLRAKHQPQSTSATRTYAVNSTRGMHPRKNATNLTEATKSTLKTLPITAKNSKNVVS